jgi:hypothetical protein
MRFLKHLVFLLGVGLPLSVHAADQSAFPLALHLHVMSMTTASAPKIIGNDILFSYAAQGTHFVGIAFSNEDFTKIHPFVRNSHGVLFYVYPLPTAQTRIVYRLVVDGLWTSDPTNPDVTYDNQGIPLSVVSLPQRTEQVVSSPVVHGDGIVQFFLKAPEDREITLVGDFNHWDPFMTRMTEIRHGLYTVTLRISPGVHAYDFVSDGTTLSDPLNPQVDYRPDGSEMSIFRVP